MVTVIPQKNVEQIFNLMFHIRMRSCNIIAGSQPELQILQH